MSRPISLLAFKSISEFSFIVHLQITEAGNFIYIHRTPWRQVTVLLKSYHMHTQYMLQVLIYYSLMHRNYVKLEIWTWNLTNKNILNVLPMWIDSGLKVRCVCQWLGLAIQLFLFHVTWIICLHSKRYFRLRNPVLVLTTPNGIHSTVCKCFYIRGPQVSSITKSTEHSPPCIHFSSPHACCMYCPAHHVWFDLSNIRLHNIVIINKRACSLHTEQYHVKGKSDFVSLCLYHLLYGHVPLTFRFCSKTAVIAQSV
jgi:hypothetical protein